MTKMFATKPSRSVCAVGIAVSLALSLSSVASAQEAASPDVATAGDRFTRGGRRSARLRHAGGSTCRLQPALKAEDPNAVAAVLGLDAVKLKADENTDDALAAIQEGAAKQIGLAGKGDRRLVLIGQKLWPLPFPVVKGEDGKWAFDTYAGLEEIVNRRVGENELQTIETMRAYVDAQEDYASEDRDEDAWRSSRRSS